MFIFTLQKILEHRKNIEEIALREFSQAMETLNAERMTMNALAEEEELLINQWKELGGHVAKVSDFSLYADYIKCVQQSVHNQTAIVDAAEKETQQKRESLLDIVKERKILETLKEKRRLAYEAQIAEQERKTLDEVAILKFRREGF
ncbi:MAG: flagellar export protein FliJ [Syntrophales bacterium]